MPKLPGPRKPMRQFKCPWCKKEFILLSQLQDHEPKCRKRPTSTCKHPRKSRLTRAVGRIITIGKKSYETIETYCGDCGKTLNSKRKRIA